MPVPGLLWHSHHPRSRSRFQGCVKCETREKGATRSSENLELRTSNPRPPWAAILLGSFATLQIPQPNLDCFPCNFCPACLRIFGEYCCCFRILNLQVQNLNDPVIDLNVCHGYSPYRGTVRQSTIGGRFR